MNKKTLGLGTALVGLTLGAPFVLTASEVVAQEATTQVYSLSVEGTVLATFNAVDTWSAEQQVKIFATANGITVTGYDAETLTFIGAYDVVEETTTTVEETTTTEEVKEPVEEFVYFLKVKTSDTTISTEYTASNDQLAEMYFRNYVNENGLGTLKWSYDKDSRTFVALGEGVELTTTTVESTTTTKEESTESEKESESKKDETKESESVKEEESKDESESTESESSKENEEDETKSESEEKIVVKPVTTKALDVLPDTGEVSPFAIYGASLLSVLAGLGFVIKNRK